jgi:hypothetical protein
VQKMGNPVKKCKVCKCTFEPRTSTQAVCCFGCAITLVREHKEKEQRKKAQIERKDHREAKQKAKSRGQWLKEAQTAFNAFIRKRDEGLPCISCGSYTGKKNAGHYRSVGSCPELRFEPLQVWLQCEKCNSYLSGNLINYRIKLIRRIGADKVEWLEGPHEPKKYTIPELMAIKAEYKLKLKDFIR